MVSPMVVTLQAVESSGEEQGERSSSSAPPRYLFLNWLYCMT